MENNFIEMNLPIIIHLCSNNYFIRSNFFGASILDKTIVTDTITIDRSVTAFVFDHQLISPKKLHHNRVVKNYQL